MKKNNTKILLIGIVALMLTLVTGASFAYWDSLNASSDISLNLGEGTVLDLTVGSNTADGKTLVPTGVMMGANDVDSVTFNYTVELSKTPVNPAALTVAVVADSIKIDDNSAYASLVNVTINAPSTISTTADISIVITLTEPADEAAYAAVAGKAITLSIEVIAA